MYSKEIANKIQTFLKDDDWEFTFFLEGEVGVFKTGLALNEELMLKYFILVREDNFSVHAISPIAVNSDDKEKIREVAEFIHRVNLGLSYTTFLFDFDKGAILLKSNVDCEGIQPSFEMVRNSLYCIGRIYERYFKGIVDILSCDVSASEAKARCESDS
jgi:hypothetical protein